MWNGPERPKTLGDWGGWEPARPVLGQNGGFNQNCPFWGGKARRGRREPPRRGCPGPGPRQSVLLVKGPASLKSTNWKAWETSQRSETRDKAREHNEMGRPGPLRFPVCAAAKLKLRVGTSATTTREA